MYKWQLGITFLGAIVLWTGPHLGSDSDATIWRRTRRQHRFRRGERWLGDLGYVGCRGILTKFKKNQMNGPGRRIDKRRFNRAHERIRNRVENVVRYVKRHQLFAQGRAFTHSVEELATVMKIVGHVSALELQRFQRFRSFGPWPH